MRSKQYRQLLNSKKAIFEIRHLTDFFVQIMWPQFEASCRAFQYENLLIKI